jgi:hypothetical protein
LKVAAATVFARLVSKDRADARWIARVNSSQDNARARASAMTCREEQRRKSLQQNTGIVIMAEFEIHLTGNGPSSLLADGDVADMLFRQRESPFLQSVREALVLRHYSGKTVEAYVVPCSVASLWRAGAHSIAEWAATHRHWDGALRP